MVVYTSSNPLTVVKNGTEYRLDTLAYNISTKGGIAGSMAALRGSSPIVPGRNGSLYAAGRKRDEGAVVLSMWAQDTDTDGVGDADRYARWRQNMDFILWLFDTQNAQIELREYVVSPGSPGTTLAGKPYRRAFVEIPTAIDPEMRGRVYGEFKAECRINDTYWEDGVEATFDSPLNAAAIGIHNITELNGSTAPIEDALITVFGPMNTGARVIDPRTLHECRLNTAIAGGGSWVIDCKNWTYSIGATNVTASTVIKGRYSPRPFGISPEALTPRIQLLGAGTGATTRLQVKARRKFH